MDYTTNTEISTLFESKPAMEWIEEAGRRPTPRQLWHELWHEGELTCLFADTNVGKSIYAIQIANEIGKEENIIYFDFEMSDKQFQLRYTDPDTGEYYPMSPGFLRASYSQDAPLVNDVGLIIDRIVDHCLDKKANILIIDNISWICNRSESGDAAGELMQKLVETKRRYGMSILVLAHTPKRNISAPLNQNSLAGSKKLANFFDAIFAIGIDKNRRPGGRYIKQIKVRTGEMLYGEGNVITAELIKEGAALHFVETGHDMERNMLDEPDAIDIERENARAEIMRRIKEGSTVRSICKELHVSPNTVVKIKKENEPEAPQPQA